jgi:endogenous inhibitor of DNA gyrase (YacG/DUF329 family)
MSLDKTVIHCPTCKKAGKWSTDNPFRPFCSERCKLIDLGSWAAEEHRIPDQLSEGKTSLDDQNEDGDESQ